LLGQYLKLPNNSIRILVGCGAAAAIAGSFNTPIAGVIFSMEVIILEYTIAGFVPVILAAVVASFLNQLVFGADIAFGVPPVAMVSFYDLPFLILEGIFIGSIAALFVKTIQVIHDLAPTSLPLKLIIAATVTGLAALLVPQVLGIGYDTVNSTLLGEIPLLILMAVCFLKLLTSATSVALGMPVGLIGPTIFIGALAGGILAAFAHYLTDGLSSPAFYVMLGMGAMMGAALQAPLAALMAVVEMTHNPNIILPAMLVIVVANIVASELYGQKSIFITQMEMLGLDFRQNPLSMALNRASVASIMSRSFLRVSQLLDAERINEINATRPQWLLVDGDTILRTEDLVTYLDVNSIDIGNENIHPINLNEIPATRKDVTSILLQATLSEALDTINDAGVGALYVNRISAPLMDSPVGIVTKEDIESYYQL
jgi:CIC family chloride channel protein